MKNDYIDTVYSENSRGADFFRPFNPNDDRNTSMQPGMGQDNSQSQDRSREQVSALDIENEDKVTFIGYFSNPPRIIFGSKEGCVTIYTMSKKEPIV